MNKLFSSLKPWLVILCLGFAPSVFATLCPPSTTCCWQNTLAMYGWVFGQRGCMDINGETIDVDVTPQDVLENLDIIDFILQIHMETRKGRWAFMIDPTFLKTTVSNQIANTRLSVVTKTGFVLVDFAGFYTIGTHCFCTPGRWLQAELYVGGRDLYSEFDANLQPFQFAINEGNNWLAAMIGTRVTFHVNDCVNLWFRADVAAGSHNHSYNFQAFASYAFSKNWFVAAGFRALDFCGTENVAINPYKMDMLYYGPILGVGLQW